MLTNDEMDFKNLLKSCKNILVLTGAGISAESGVPTFRGSGGFWRKYQSQQLASLEAFNEKPWLVWEFYHYRRELCLKANPNNGHKSLAKFEELCQNNNKQFILLTQNVDNLHRRAGSKNIIEFHGNLYRTRCTKCLDIQDNYDSPICESLRDRGAPDLENPQPILVENLPRCKKCSGLLRPDIIWFGEAISKSSLEKAEEAMEICDLCIVAGTSNLVYPAAGYPMILASKDVPVIEFNIESTSLTDYTKYFFKGPCGEMLPKLME